MTDHEKCNVTVNLDLSIEFLLGFDSETNQHLSAMQSNVFKDEEQKLDEQDR